MDNRLINLITSLHQKYYKKLNFFRSKKYDKIIVKSI